MDNEGSIQASRTARVLAAQEQMKSLESKGESYLAAPALNDVLVDNIGLVNLLITRDLRFLTFKPRVGIDEMRQEGLLALARAALSYDPEMGSVSNYASLAIKKRCQRYGRLLMTLPRVPAYTMNAYVRAMVEGDLWGVHFDSSSEFIREIPNTKELSTETLANVYFSHEDPEKVDYDIPSIDGNDQQFIETFFGNFDESFEETPRQLIDDSQEVMLERAFEVEGMHTKLSEIRHKLAFINKVNPRMHAIIERRLLFPVGETQPTLESLGDEFGLTRERIRQIEVKALELLRDPEKYSKYEARFQNEKEPSSVLRVGHYNKNALLDLDLSSEELAERLSMLKDINERMASIVRMRYLDDEKPTQRKIAHIYGISQHHVSTLERRALQLLGSKDTLQLKHAAVLEAKEAVQEVEPGLLKNQQNGAVKIEPVEETVDREAFLGLNKSELEQRLSFLKRFNPWLATVVTVRYVGQVNLSEAAQMLGVSIAELHADEHSAISWLQQANELAARVRTIESYGAKVNWG